MFEDVAYLSILSPLQEGFHIIQRNILLITRQGTEITFDNIDMFASFYHV